jgi:hypothetical protein
MSEFPILEDVTIGACDTGVTACPDETFDANESNLQTNAHEAPSELTHCKTMFEQDMTNPNSKLSYRPVTNMEDSDYDNIDGFTLTYMAQEYQENTHGTTIVLNDDFGTSNYLVHSKLHKDVEAIPREDLENMWHSRSKHQESTSHSLLQANGNKTCFYSHLENNDYAEFLLDAITCQVGNIPNSVSSHSTNSLTSSQTQIQSEKHAVRIEEWSVPDHPGGQEFSPISVNDGFTSYKVTVSSPAEINKTMTEECMGHTNQDVRGDSVKIKHGCRKTELHKARPRDRQLIQDRMKELRELIPNASKVELLNSDIYPPLFNCVCLQETNSVLIESCCKK